MFSVVFFSSSFFHYKKNPLDVLVFVDLELIKLFLLLFHFIYEHNPIFQSMCHCNTCDERNESVERAGKQQKNVRDTKKYCCFERVSQMCWDFLGHLLFLFFFSIYFFCFLCSPYLNVGFDGI